MKPEVYEKMHRISDNLTYIYLIYIAFTAFKPDNCGDKQPNTAMQTGIHAHMFTSLLILALSACTSVQPMPNLPASQQPFVNGCNIKEHAKCVYLTGKETLEDGRNGKWTRHWFRMSYIGKACEQRHGKTVAVILESLFAIPHYTLIAIGNGAAALAAPFRSEEPAAEPADTLSAEK